MRETARTIAMHVPLGAFGGVILAKPRWKCGLPLAMRRPLPYLGAMKKHAALGKYLPFALLGMGAFFTACQAVDGAATTSMIQDTWHLESVNGTEVMSGSNVTLTMADDGHLHGYAGCNQYSGRYATEGRGLNISPAVTSTLRACAADGMMKQERTYLNALPHMTRARVEGGDKLVLSSTRGETLVFGKAN